MQKEQTLIVKGMVCHRCILSISALFNKLGFFIKDISLGRISYYTNELNNKAEEIKIGLKDLGFDVVEDKHQKFVSDLKQICEQYINETHLLLKKPKLSDYLSDKLNMSYERIRELFSGYEGTSIEKYMIIKRLDKVKELLIYSDDSLTEIAYQNGFSSVQHLSRQFKDVIGQTPSEFQRLHRWMELRNHVK
jgi:AraC-like DNA-binding protein